MKKAITLGLIVAALVTGCDKKEDSNQDNIQYFNPNPQVQVVESGLSSKHVEYKNVSYDTLVDMIRKNGGSLEIDLSTVDIGKENKHPLPSYAGYGYAWANKMQGSLEQNILTTITASDVKKSKERFFLSYKGYGYAWMNGASGNIGGNSFNLTTTKVGKKNESPFPSYAGYGHAWTQEMTGDLGDILNLSLITTDYKTKNEHPFPSYAGYGHAWMNEAKLIISLK